MPQTKGMDLGPGQGPGLEMTRSEADLLKLYLEKYPDKSIDEAFDALNRLKGEMAVQQRRTAEEATPGIDLVTRGGMLDQNFEQARRSEVLREGALKREQERMKQSPSDHMCLMGPAHKICSGTVREAPA